MSRSKEFRVPTLMAAALAVAFAHVSLRLLGLRRSLRLVRSHTRGRVSESTASQEAIRSACRRVAKAAAFYPGRAECLEQSLAVHLLLRRRGVAAELRMGVRPSPFTAHAWIEYQGRPVNETEDFIHQLTPFPSLGG